MAGKDFLEATKNAVTSRLLLEALEHVSVKQTALDIGSGAFVDARFLANEGFSVDAVDKSENVVDYYVPTKGLNFFNIPIEDFKLLPERYDLVTAQYSLPFIHPDIFNEVFLKILYSIKKGGVFVGQFFGPEDEWSKNEKMTFLSLEEAVNHFSGFEILKSNEMKGMGKTAVGNEKYWHVIEIVTKKS